MKNDYQIYKYLWFLRETTMSQELAGRLLDELQEVRGGGRLKKKKNSL